VTLCVAEKMGKILGGRALLLGRLPRPPQAGASERLKFETSQAAPALYVLTPLYAEDTHHL
jgi:hypothetical protein